MTVNKFDGGASETRETPFCRLCSQRASSEEGAMGQSAILSSMRHPQSARGVTNCS
jgi:hypothetical protein